MLLTKKRIKLNFRLIVKDFNNDDLDVTTGELARHSSTTSSKMNRDFTKSALTTKAHLNAALKRMSYIPPNKIKTVVATTNIDEYISAVIPYPDSEDE